MKTRFWSLRLTLAEYKALLACAEEEMLTPSSFVRRIIHQSAAWHILPAPLMRQLNREAKVYGFRKHRRKAIR